VLLVTLVIFVIVRIIGDPAHLMLPPEATESDRNLLRIEMGLDRPLIVQYATYLMGLLSGDFGTSYRYERPALELILEALGPTLLLTSSAISVAILIGIPLGVAAAMHRDGWIDKFAKVFAILGQSAPPFFFGLIFIRFFSVQFGWLPSGGYGSIAHLILPTLALGWYSAAGIMRLTNSCMIEVLGLEYIKMARIKGLKKFKVTWKHALKNAILPVITFTALQFGILMGGAVSTEFVFAWPGLGRLLVSSISNLDYVIVQAAVTLAAFVFTTINLGVDILYAYIDPRIKYG
jgi:peptide/nickel transport system permease protein